MKMCTCSVQFSAQALGFEFFIASNSFQFHVGSIRVSVCSSGAFMFVVIFVCALGFQGILECSLDFQWSARWCRVCLFFLLCTRASNETSTVSYTLRNGGNQGKKLHISNIGYHKINHPRIIITNRVQIITKIYHYFKNQHPL